MLLAPLRYWKIQHPKKFVWDWILPTIGSFGLTFALVIWPKVTGIFSVGYIPSLQNLLAVLGGFFIAALTLLTTSETKALAQPIAGIPPVRFGNEPCALERRRFLCLLFGYLSFSCFALYVVGLLASIIAPGFREFAGEYRTLIIAAFLIAYNFWLSHMFVATLVGLYYFTDRLQRPDVELVRKVEGSVQKPLQ